MIEKNFIFLAGHHRSGTSLLHEIMKEHPLISGFSDTGVIEDEGQLLQTVYEPAKTYGGPGKYIFNDAAYMNESHPLSTTASAERLLAQWERHYDTERPFYIEKSPPNLIKTRFQKSLFPKSRIVVNFSQTVDVGYATQKWSRTSIKRLVEHTLRGYEIFADDRSSLQKVYALRYEDFVAHPQREIDKVWSFLEMESQPIRHDVRANVNDKYFAMWEKNRSGLINRLRFRVDEALEARANRFGYSLNDCRQLQLSTFFGNA
ncbi:MAG: sulfotransferase [Pseudomonadota bacterium]